MDPERKTFLGIGFLLVFTPVGLFLAYGNYSLFSTTIRPLMETFNKWPWFRVSIILTIITTLSAHLTGKAETYDGCGTAIGYGWGAMPILLLLISPGPKQLGLHSDPNFFTAILFLAIIHAIGFRLIADAEVHRKALKKQKLNKFKD